MIAVQTILPPAWVTALVDDVLLPAVMPHGFVGRFGYRVWEPEEHMSGFDGWQVAAYPSPYEIRSAHAHDGGRSYGAFALDVKKLLSSFSDVEDIAWRSNANQHNLSSEFDCPEIVVAGKFAGRRVRLRVFGGPPIDEPISHFVDPANKTAVEA
jgi:hypothetical protein